MLYVLVALVCFALPSSLRATETGCTVDGKIVAPGQQYDFPGTCGMNVCKGDNLWDQMACGLISSAEGWTFVPEDTSKGYPECCAHSVPPCLTDGVISGVIGDGSIRSYSGLKIAFDQTTVDHCKELTPSQTQIEPSVSFTPEPQASYLLALVDLDAPSEHKNVQFLHWMVANIKGNKVEDGCVLAEYSGPTPPPGTGLHRYMFVLFKQPKEITFTEKKILANSIENRKSFSLKEFANKHDLEPLMLNLFKCQQPHRD